MVLARPEFFSSALSLLLPSLGYEQRRSRVGNQARLKRRGRYQSTASRASDGIMATAGRVGGTRGGFMENAYRLLMRRNSVYVTFILTGAIVGERVVDYGINKIWEANNVGKRYEDIPNLGSKAEPAEDE